MNRPADYRQTFQAMLDGELIERSFQSEMIHPDAKQALALEIECRLNGALRTSNACHWVTISRKQTVRYPQACPKCGILGAMKSIQHQSHTKSKYRVIYVKQEWLSLDIPYCLACASALERDARIGLWISIILAIPLFASTWYFELGRLGFAISILISSIPSVVMSRKSQAVEIAAFSSDSVDIGFKSETYAPEFAKLNGGQDHSAEVLEDLKEAIQRLRKPSLIAGAH